jgi:DNA-binding NarL/FixJ family response regulator
MSANSDHETTLSAYEVGVDAFLPKPFRVDAFRSTIQTMI